MKRKLIDSCIISLLFGGSLLLQAAPPIISYTGQVAVNGSPFTGTGQFKFAFVGGNGQFSYWSQDGTSTSGSEPTGYVSALVSNGIYSIMLGDDAISGMGTINESIFQNPCERIPRDHHHLWDLQAIASKNNRIKLLV